MRDKYYTNEKDFVDDAKMWQSVKNENEAREALNNKNADYGPDEVFDERMRQKYPCEDNYKMGTIQDDRIYIALTDEQHKQLVDFSHMDSDQQREFLQKQDGPITAQGGLSGYFSDQDTVKACADANNVLDNTKYNEWCQIAPRLDKDTGKITYKPHVDCLHLNFDRMEEVYHTRNFNAAVAKCDANNQFGCGGGNQGYNPCLNEFIGNGCLEYGRNDSYSDIALCDKEYANPNHLTNSYVSKTDYKRMMDDATQKTEDCIKNNTPHPSDAVRNIGYTHNPEPVKSDTGHAILWDKYNSSGEESSDKKEGSLGVGANTEPKSNSPNENTINPKENLSQENSFCVGAKDDPNKNLNKVDLQEQKSVLGAGAEIDPSLKEPVDDKGNILIDTEQAGKKGAEASKDALEKSAEIGKEAAKKSADITIDTGIGM